MKKAGGQGRGIKINKMHQNPCLKYVHFVAIYIVQLIERNPCILIKAYTSMLKLPANGPGDGLVTKVLASFAILRT